MGQVNIIQNGVSSTSGSEITISINGDTGNISAGGKEQSGELILGDDSSVNRIGLNAKDGHLIIRAAPEAGAVIPFGLPRVSLNADANMYIGGNDADGDIVIFPAGGDNSSLDQSTIHLDGQTG